jgi:hypothetical protein
LFKEYRVFETRNFRSFFEWHYAASSNSSRLSELNYLQDTPDSSSIICHRPISKNTAKSWEAVSVTSAPEGKPASTELTGGAGFTYEDTVGAYYLAHLLRREGASGQAGVVVSVAVQQQGHGNPMDDLVVEFDEVGTKRVLGLQIKRSVTISGADAGGRRAAAGRLEFSTTPRRRAGTFEFAGRPDRFGRSA